jgi:hypothetical protein
MDEYDVYEEVCEKATNDEKYANVQEIPRARTFEDNSVAETM